MLRRDYFSPFKTGRFFVFSFFVLLVMSLSPRVQATPGATCPTQGSTVGCDPCNSETCVNSAAPVAVILVCANGTGDFSPGAPATPACPGVVVGAAPLPSCWDTCTVVTGPNNIPAAQCSPDDQFCDDNSGGDNVSNECRSATCQPDRILVPGNESGCDYEYANTDLGGFDCSNCQPNQNNQNCGNGICEKPDETFDNCSVDCRVPGFSGPVLDSANATLVTACGGKPIGFSDNVADSGFCEDGDVCTTNVCSGTGTCDINPALCSGNNSDLCCPAGCSPDSDIDCLAGQSCGIPPTVLCLEGSGDIVGGESVLPSCDTCALHKDAPSLPGAPWVWMGMMGLSLGALLALKRGHR